MTNPFGPINLPAQSLEGEMAAYVRYSSDLQDETSLTDQLRKCREAAARLGCTIPDHLVFADPAISGQSMHNRPGLQKLLTAVRENPSFKGVVCEDTSRLARNLDEALRLCKILRCNEVFLHIASTGLDSRNPAFDMALTIAAMMDEAFIVSHRARVRRGQEGQVKRGYTPGGSCYGYSNVRDEDAERKGLHGHQRVKGSLQEPNPEEAAIVRLIFQARAAGASLRDIAKSLNDAGVPPAQLPRKKGIRSWCPSAIREMLRNERYIGRTIYGRTQKKKDENGRDKVVDMPKSEWTEAEIDRLRIIPQELWDAVQSQNEKVREKYGPKRLGGMLRTETSRRYLFSSLLRCGLCGANITICAGKVPNARYGCLYHRNRGVCANSLTISQRSLEEQLLDRIATTLRCPQFRAEIAAQFDEQVSTATRAELARKAEARENNIELKRELSELHRKAENLADAIAENTDSRILAAALRRHESRIREIEQTLNSTEKPIAASFDEGEKSRFLEAKLDSLVDVLRGDPILTKQELLKRIDKLVLTPEVRDGSEVYVVSGSVGLFTANDDAMQNKALEGIAQHCIGLKLSLDGAVLMAKKHKRAQKASAQETSSITGTAGQFPSINDGEIDAIPREGEPSLWAA